MIDHPSAGGCLDSVEGERAAVGPIEPVDTAVAAFIGRTAKGQGEPVLVSSWSDFTAKFGAPLADGYLGACVHGYFLNGGAQAYILSIGTSQREPLTLVDHLGRSAERNGLPALEALEAIPAVTMVCAPDLWAGYDLGTDPDDAHRVQRALIDHCEKMGDRVAILDAPPGLTAQQAHDWRVTTVGFDSKFAVLYFPWLKVFDEAAGVGRLIPPSGHLAGVWARSDAHRGVHKAATNEVVRGVIGVGCAITRAEHELLDPVGVNCVRAFLGRGVRVWGAHTLSSDPRWHDISVRRLVSHVEASLREGTKWLATEANDEQTRDRLVRSVRSFLFHIWLAGGLVGDSVAEAFYVTCEDNAADGADLTCEVGIAADASRTFTVFRLSQHCTGGTQIRE